MPESPDMSLRTTRSSIVRPVRAPSARRPSSAIPRLTELKIRYEDENYKNPDDSTVDTSSTVCNQTMDVYLRLKPRLTKSKKLKKIPDEAYTVADTSTLLTKFPSLEGSTNPSKKSKISESTSRKFTFTKIFAAESSQQEFFDQAVKQRVIDFLAGQSYSLMTYGTMNSGKSYTLHGSTESPGVIPRSIEFVFSGIDCTLSPWYKPLNLTDVQSLNEAQRRQETELRQHFLDSRLIDKSLCETSYKSVANSMKEEREISKNGESMHCVWLSFAEIYNDNVYDLLSDDDNQAKLTPLKLVKDKMGRTFVQGLRTICATTGLEAYEIFMAGQAKLTIDSTNLNPRSSRSHSIFTMKLLKFFKERVPEEVEVSTMTFCDLAGTGRSKKSTGSGNELKEAKNINKSLLVLGRCFKAVADCQMTKHNVEIGGPFRESKLTRLFQRALSGKENLTLIVNVDTSPDLYVETQGVLNFSTIVRKILVDVGRDSRKFYVPELMIASPRADSATLRRPASSSVIEAPSEAEETKKSKSENLTDSNDLLKKEIEILRGNALNREYEIRNEMANLYAGIIKDLEANWRKRTEDVEVEQEDYLKWSVKQVENFYKERIDSLTNRKRRRTSGGDERDDSKSLFEELEAENTQITSKVIGLRETIKELKEELEILSTDKNKCVFELGLAKDEIRQIRELLDEERGEKVVINDNSLLIDELRNLINEKNETIANLQRKLEATKEKSAKINRNTFNINDSESETKSIEHSTILTAVTTEELEEELRKRSEQISEIPHAKLSKQIEVLEESGVELDEEVDAKFSSSTFKKENDLSSPRKSSINETEDSMIDEETKIPIVSSMVSEADEAAKNLHSSFFDTIDKVFRSTDQNGNNCDDSGITVNNTSSSPENSLKHETQEKASQTSLKNHDEINERNNQMIQDRVEQLKLDYNKLKAEHLRETMRVTELSQELECIQYALGDLKGMTKKNEEKINNYQKELTRRENDLSNLGRAKSEIETRLLDVTKQLEIKSIAYEKKIVELSEKLKIREESELRTSKSLEEYLEKSSFLENELSAAHAQLDKTSMKCLTEHMPKIESLEREVFAKTVRVNELDEKISEVERDLARVTELNEKVTDFEMIFEKYQSEKAELRRQLLERLEMQSTLECKLKKLTSKVHERENEISSLRMDLSNVVKMNMENSERARELNRETIEARARITSVKGEMTRSEDERRKLDRMSGHEIGNLIARLADFEKNAALLARMRDKEDSRMDELERLKLLLHEKEREMGLFKKNRDKTIRRYEALIRKLQADVEVRCNRESSKLRMLYPKRAISKESLRSIAGSFHWKSTLHQSVEKIKSSQGAIGERRSNRFRASDRCSCAHIYPNCSRIIKRSSSHAFVTPSTSVEGSRSSESKNFPMRDDDDDECMGNEVIETESHEELNMDMLECHEYGRREALSQAAATFSLPSTSDDSLTDLQNIPEWMEIRRTNGRTHFRLRRGDSSIGSEGKRM